MFSQGVIKTYNADRGFGFIKIEGDTKDLFFHIKDFPHKNIEPKIGEKLKFRIVEDQGKLKADNIVRLDVKIQSVDSNQNLNSSSSIQSQNSQYKSSGNQHSRTRSSRHKNSNESQSFGNIAFIGIGLIAIAVLIYMIYGKYQRARLAAQAPQEITTQQVVTPVDSNTNHYQCDGRIHCSQMNSREEARWFVRNCPGTKMDGNNDGEPCENDSRW